MFGTLGKASGSAQLNREGEGGECWERRSERRGQCCSEVGRPGRRWSALSSFLQWGLSARTHFLPRFLYDHSIERFIFLKKFGLKNKIAHFKFWVWIAVKN